MSAAGYRLSVVLPAYNEEDNIVEAVSRATAVAERLCVAHEIVVVDDGSTDETAPLVEQTFADDPRVRLVRHERNLGYGEAVRSGLRAARLDLLFLTDADNQFDLDELERFLPWTDRVDVVAGYRLNRQDNFNRRLNAKAWNGLMRLLFYVPVRDIDCAFKVFRRQPLESVDLETVGAMVSTEIMVKLGRAGASVVELGVNHYPRTAGKARGAHLSVVGTALREAAAMHRRFQRQGEGNAPVLDRPGPAPRPGCARVVVIGGGIAGSAAALRLARAGKKVTVIERSPALGGLVVSFAVGGTPLECFYHHVFPHEEDIVALIHELGLGDRLGWYPSSTGVLHEGRIWPFTTPQDLLRFSPLPLVDRLRAGIGALRLGRVRDWHTLDRLPAAVWLRRYCGDAAGRVLWDPLLAAKFGSAADRVPAAWMWGRINQRLGARQGGGERLGYLRGGFKQLFAALDTELRAAGVDVVTSEEVRSIELDDGRVRGVETASGPIEADAVLYAGALGGLPRLLPDGAADPRWSAIGSLGVLCVVLELRRGISPIYWTNVCDPSLPFGGIIEHTNLLPTGDYGDRHIVYLSRYFTLDEPVATVDPMEEAQRWVKLLVEAVDGLEADDVIDVHPFRTPSAAPLVSLGHLMRMPPLQSDVEGLYVMTTAQIYPQDRGMDEGVKAGYHAADVIAGRAARRHAAAPRPAVLAAR